MSDYLSPLGKNPSVCLYVHGSAEGSKSRMGITFKHGEDNGSFHSVSAAQKCVTASSAEAEYVGRFEAGKYIVWLRQLMAEL